MIDWTFHIGDGKWSTIHAIIESAFSADCTNGILLTTLKTLVTFDEIRV
jgi:hypothetical protein